MDSICIPPSLYILICVTFYVEAVTAIVFHLRSCRHVTIFVRLVLEAQFHLPSYASQYSVFHQSGKTYIKDGKPTNRTNLHVIWSLRVLPTDPVGAVSLDRCISFFLVLYIESRLSMWTRLHIDV